MTAIDASTAQGVAGDRAAPTPAPVGFLDALGAVYAGQVARARVTRAPLLVVATIQSLGLVVLLRGVIAHTNDLTAQSIVAGSTVLVVAFVSLNLLAQRLGALRASGLEHYAALAVPSAAVILGVAAAYSTFTIPGVVVTAVVGALLYGLPLAHLWLLVPVVVVAGAGLAGVGALIGLLAPRPEIATVLGQLGMTAVLFLGIIPAQRFPEGLRVVRDVAPSTWGVDALASALRRHPDWSAIAADLAIGAAVAAVAVACAGLAYRRAVTR